MSLTHDFEQILETALPTDPSFRRIEQAVIDSWIRETRQRALKGDTEGFLLSAMRLLALPDNGHTRHPIDLGRRSESIRHDLATQLE